MQSRIDEQPREPLLRLQGTESGPGSKTPQFVTGDPLLVLGSMPATSGGHKTRGKLDAVDGIVEAGTQEPGVGRAPE
jgi:hypothetical protein